MLTLCGCGDSRSLKIVSDLPLTGVDAHGEAIETPAGVAKVKAIEDVMKKAGGACRPTPSSSVTGVMCTGAKVGKTKIRYESYDDATAAANGWNEATCADNARTYVKDSSIVGVIGPGNSGCAAIEIPILTRPRWR